MKKRYLIILFIAIGIILIAYSNSIAMDLASAKVEANGGMDTNKYLVLL